MARLTWKAKKKIDIDAQKFNSLFTDTWQPKQLTTLLKC